MLKAKKIFKYPSKPDACYSIHRTFIQNISLHSAGSSFVKCMSAYATEISESYRNNTVVLCEFLVYKRTLFIVWGNKTDKKHPLRFLVKVRKATRKMRRSLKGSDVKAAKRCRLKGIIDIYHRGIRFRFRHLCTRDEIFRLFFWKSYFRTKKVNSIIRPWCILHRSEIITSSSLQFNKKVILCNF